jgi:hypothetical protein
MILCKSSVLLEDEHYSQILRLSWEILLDRNEELSACAGNRGRNGKNFLLPASPRPASNFYFPSPPRLAPKKALPASPRPAFSRYFY